MLIFSIMYDIINDLRRQKNRNNVNMGVVYSLPSQKELFENLKQSSTLSDIQTYIKKVLKLRGFEGQTAKDKILLLVEEVGELAKAVRKNSSGASVDPEKIQNYDSVESEIADVLIVLISVANILNVDVFKSLKEKEQININRKWKINSENKK